MELDIDSPGNDKSTTNNTTTTTMTIKNEVLDDHMVPATMTTTTELVQPSNESTSPIPFTQEVKMAKNGHQWSK